MAVLVLPLRQDTIAIGPLLCRIDRAEDIDAIDVELFCNQADRA